MKKLTNKFVKDIETWNSGGYVMFDVIHLNSGQILVVSDECVCRYDSLGHFETEFEDDFEDNNCIEFTYEDDLIDAGYEFVEEIHSGIRDTCYFCKEIWGNCNCSLKIKPFEWNGIEIKNPLVDSSGRFFVDPWDFYGIAFIKALED